MTARIAPNGVHQFLDNNGFPLAGGKVYTYAAGTTTPQQTWTDAAQTTPNANPVILDSAGRAVIFWSGIYKVVVKTSADVTLSTVDNMDTTPAVDATQVNAALTQAGVAAVLYPRTAAEIAASVTPSNYAIPSHAAIGMVLLERYGGAGDGVTSNNTAFTSATAVAGRIDMPVAFTHGSTGVWLFSQAWVLSGTSQGSGGIGAPTGSGSPCRLIGIGGQPLVKFSGISAGTDCITLGGSQLPQVEVRNLQFDFNNTGRDGMVILGSNQPILDNVLLYRPQRDALVLSPDGTAAQWIEKGSFDIKIRDAGRHGVRMELISSSGATNPYINECRWPLYELRGCSKNYAGGQAIKITKSGAGTLAGAAKVSAHNFMKTVWDCIYPGSGNVPAVSPVTNDAGVVVENILFQQASWENTSAVSPGVGYSVQNNGSWGGLFMLSNITNSFWGTNGIDPSIVAVWNFDYSFAKTQLYGATTVKGANDNTTVLDLSGQTTTGTAGDVRVVRTGSAVNTVGQGANVILGNTTGTTFAAIQEYAGALVVYTFASGAWGERARIKSDGGVQIAGLSTVYSVNGGAPSAGTGSNGDFAFRQDTPGTANQRIYVKNAGAWTGIV